jgi:hypothetical protein
MISNQSFLYVFASDAKQSYVYEDCFSKTHNDI